MSKYDHLKVLRETRARTQHECARCGFIVNPGEIYYREALSDKYIRTMIRFKAYCAQCYSIYGDSLLRYK